MIDPDNFFFILVRPTYLGNIGSVARVLKNFGFKNMRLVAPPKNYKDAEARKMSVAAFDVLKAAQCFDSVEDALKDMNISLGTTSAFQRDCTPVSLLEIGPQLKRAGSNRVGIVFGDERDGLQKEELDRCQSIVCIPCNPDFSSLNLAQAVGIIAYELIRKEQEVSHADPDALSEAIVNGADADDYFLRLNAMLSEIGFTKSFNKVSIATELRTLFNKAKPTEREFRLLDAILRKVSAHGEITTQNDVGEDSNC